jgi:23S rRNA (guanine745-N1)-methyltransferase
MTLEAVVDLLRCPHCRRPVDLANRVVRCPNGHSFDLARQGYVNLMTGPIRGDNADSGEMVAARDRFLSGGHYRPLADRLAELAAAATRPGAAITEAGAGTGYYLAQLIGAIDGARGIATDLSAAACRRAARVHPRIGAVVADTWAGLPIGDQLLDLIMVVFAPRNPADFARMLRPGGRLLIASAGQDHLAEIRRPLGLIDVRPGKPAELRQSLQDWFDVEHSEDLDAPLSLDSDALADLVGMGPSAHHRPDDLADRIAGVTSPAPVTLSVSLSVFRRR